MSGTATMAPGTLERALRDHRDAGRKLLIAYVTGGLGRDWVEVVRAIGAAGADAIEIGIPFSDPVMDGPTIQRASAEALESGATPFGIIAALATADAGVPLAVMTYYNIVLRAGHRRIARTLAAAGVSGAIVPDLPIDELDGWGDEANEAGVETVLLVAPTTPERRLKAICARSRGFVYGVGVMGVTGERQSVGATALTVAARCKQETDVPVLIGVGISNPDQAREVVAVADGVVVGSALVHRLLQGAGPEGAAAFVAELRAAIDA
ncbi:MAG: tryptophan synthase subunit alpha [Acidimicrobiales bacterium]